MFDFYNREIGLSKFEDIDNIIHAKILSEIRGMKICNDIRLFHSRTTCLKWHPVSENILMLGSKHGSVLSWDVRSKFNVHLLNNEVGPGGCITSLNMSLFNLQNVIFTSVNGCTSSKDIETDKVIVILNTSQYSRWYTCSSILSINDLLLVGDNFGGVTFIDIKAGNSLRNVGHLHLHTGRINDMELCPWDDHLIVTASSDFTVCLWDDRLLLAKLGSFNDSEPPRKDALYTLSHKSGVSSAKFNQHTTLTGKKRYLVTIDQMREIRIYEACGSDPLKLWICTQIIEQHHRFFHHKTPFKVDWHPHENLIVVGHWGTSPPFHCTGDKSKEAALSNEDKEPTIDVINAASGKVVHKFKPSLHQICSTLNSFSCNGSYLASTCCFNVVIRATETAAEDFEQTDRNRNRGF